MLPPAYAAIVAEEARRWGRHYGVTVPVELVVALMRKENAKHDPTAKYRERDGELSRGLLMVKESTAKWLGLSDPVRLFDPRIGISYGVKYLAWQLDRYRGDVEKAVAAYNAGTAKRTSDGRQWINQRYVDDVRRLLGADAARRLLWGVIQVPGVTVTASRDATRTASKSSRTGHAAALALVLALGAAIAAAVRRVGRRP